MKQLGRKERRNDLPLLALRLCWCSSPTNMMNIDNRVKVIFSPLLVFFPSPLLVLRVG